MWLRFPLTPTYLLQAIPIYFLHYKWLLLVLNSTWKLELRKDFDYQKVSLKFWINTYKNHILSNCVQLFKIHNMVPGVLNNKSAVCITFRYHQAIYVDHLFKKKLKIVILWKTHLKSKKFMFVWSKNEI